MWTLAHSRYILCAFFLLLPSPLSLSLLLPYSLPLFLTAWVMCSLGLPCSLLGWEEGEEQHSISLTLLPAKGLDMGCAGGPIRQALYWPSPISTFLEGFQRAFLQGGLFQKEWDREAERKWKAQPKISLKQWAQTWIWVTHTEHRSKLLAMFLLELLGSLHTFNDTSWRHMAQYHLKTTHPGQNCSFPSASSCQNYSTTSYGKDFIGKCDSKWWKSGICLTYLKTI